MSKEISFSEFLKEGTFREDKVARRLEERKIKRPIHLEAEDVASEKEIKDFWKVLRQFYRTGEKPEMHNGVLVPALLAPYLESGIWDTDYPFYCPANGESPNSLEKVLQNTFNLTFGEKAPKILGQNLPRLLSYFREVASLQKGSYDFDPIRDAAIAKLGQLDVHHEEGERFRKDLADFNARLPIGGKLYNFHHSAPLYFIGEHLQDKKRLRSAFVSAVQKQISKLEERLFQETEKAGRKLVKKEDLDFANEFLVLDKIEELSPKKGSELMSESRINRIKTLIDLLRSVEFDWNVEKPYLVTTQDRAEIHELKEIFPNATLEETDLKNAFELARKEFDRNINKFTTQIIAHRKAALELDDQYVVDVHDDYFNHLKWFKLSQDELNLFHPIVLITSSTALLGDGLSCLSDCLSSNKLIKVVALTDRTASQADPDVHWEEASRSFRKELAALSISHRSAHTLQCGSDQSKLLFDGIGASMRANTPSVMQILVPAIGSDTRINLLKINAAVESRYFPYLSYDIEKGEQWGSRFDISGNPQPDKNWPTYSFKYEDVDGAPREMQVSFTYADYKALTREKIDELFIVPEAYATEHLIPVNEFLELRDDELSGKVPFIWLVDEQRRLKRGAMPYMWAVSCQERLDYWNFIQELGGLNSYHVNEALYKAKTTWDAEKEREIDALKASFEREIAVARESAAGEAMERLADVLLNLDDLPLQSSSKVVAKTSAVISTSEPDTEQEKVEEKTVPKAASSEAWLETFRCTSCNDCVDKYPLQFKYNEDKQAVIQDAKAGTYANLVQAAENCPAQCIHPGSPFNPDEPHLDEWVKRAEPFN
ncbi:MAG: ferredoxin [Flavobacteriales bacterium]|nr:ferredoxin [Flavobacteriales bacterium]